MTQQANRPEWDALCLNPMETAKYILYFDKEIKLYCLDKVEWFAHILRFDPNPDIRKVCATKYEFVALNLIKDESEEVRAACAKHWESCAKELYADNRVNVRWDCMAWESSSQLMLMNEEEDEPEIRQQLALKFIDTDIAKFNKRATKILIEELECDYDDEFVITCRDFPSKKVKLLVANLSHMAALQLVFENDEEIRKASIAKLIDENDWSCLDIEELERLCEVNENIALLILDDNLDLFPVKAKCVQLYESCAFNLLLDDEDSIVEHAQMVVLNSENKAKKLELLEDPWHNRNYAHIFLNDDDAEVREKSFSLID